MPIYEYVCRECGAEMEKLQRVSEEPLRECPECGKDGLTKKVSAAGFRLKGGGWYVTDFKGDKPKGAKEKSSGSGEKASGETSAKGKDSSESKQAKQETKKQASG